MAWNGWNRNSGFSISGDTNQADRSSGNPLRMLGITGGGVSGTIHGIPINFSGRADSPYQAAQAERQAQAAATNALKSELNAVGGDLKNMFDPLEAAINAPAGSPARNEAVRVFAQQINYNRSQGKTAVIIPGDANDPAIGITLNLDTTPRTSIRLTPGQHNLADITNKLLIGRPDLAAQVGAAIGVPLSAAQSQAPAAPAIPAGPVVDDQAALNAQKAAIGELIIKAAKAEKSGEPIETLTNTPKVNKDGNIEIPKGTYPTGQNDKTGKPITLEIKENLEISQNDLMARIKDRLNAAGITREPNKAAEPVAPATAPATPPATKTETSIVVPMGAASDDISKKLYTSADGKRRVNPAEVPTAGKDQVKEIQTMLGGGLKADGQWGPDTQEAFAKKCKEANVDPHKVNFTDPHNPELVTLMKHLDKSRVIETSVKKVATAPAAAPATATQTAAAAATTAAPAQAQAAQTVPDFFAKMGFEPATSNPLSFELNSGETHRKETPKYRDGFGYLPDRPLEPTPGRSIEYKLNGEAPRQYPDSFGFPPIRPGDDLRLTAPTPPRDLTLDFKSHEPNPGSGLPPKITGQGAARGA